MDLGGCGGVLSNGFLIHILRPELPVSVCTGVCLLYLFIPPIVSSTVESSSVQLRTRWNVPQCTNMGCAAPPPPAPAPSAPFLASRVPLSLALSLSLCHLPPTVQSRARARDSPGPTEKKIASGNCIREKTRPIMPSSWSVHVARFLRLGDGNGGRRILPPTVSLETSARISAGNDRWPPRIPSGIPGCAWYSPAMGGYYRDAVLVRDDKDRLIWREWEKSSTLPTLRLH